MATTVAPIAHSATPYSIMLQVNGGAPRADAPVTFTIDQLMAALADGPLKQTLRAADPLTLYRFNVDGARGNEIRIYNGGVSLTDAQQAAGFASNIHWLEGATTAIAGLSCEVPGAEGNACNLIIEIRLNHSVQA